MTIMFERSKEVIAKWASKGLNANGELIPDGRPTSRHVKRSDRPPSMFEIVREAVRAGKLDEDAKRLEMDTFEESLDFGPDEDGIPIPRSKYERFGEELTPAGYRELQAEKKAKAVKAAKAAAEARDRRPAEPRAEPDDAGDRRRGMSPRDPRAGSGEEVD